MPPCTSNRGKTRPVDREALHPNRQRVPGLRTRYFSEPNVTKLQHEELTATISMNGSLPFTDGQTENYSIEWIGCLEVPKDGTYHFTCRHDDGAQMYLDSQHVFGSWNEHGSGHGTSKGSIDLVAGTHPIYLRFNQGGGEHYLDMKWSGPGFDQQAIPTHAFSTLPWEGMQQQKPMLTFLFIGHSNMQGQASEPVGKAHPRAWIYYDHAWRPPYANDRGPMRPLLATLAEMYPGYRIGGWKITQNGSSVARDWSKGTRKYAEIQQAITELKATSHFVGIVSMLGWVDGGERDDETAQNFSKDFTTFISNIREDSGYPQLPWLASKAEWGKSAMKSDATKPAGTWCTMPLKTFQN